MKGTRVAVVVSSLAIGFAALMRTAAQAPPRLELELQDYAPLPITADNTNTNRRAQLARVNYLRDEPGGRRFFVNDLNGRLYILDKQTKQFTTYLDFNGAEGRPGLFQRFSFKLNFATGLTNFLFDPDHAHNGVFYTLHMEEPAIAAPATPRAGIVPDLREHTTTSTVSENGRYRIPNDNPFTTVDGARKEIWAYGLRNPHRLIWDVDPARPATPTLLAFNIGLVTWETVVVIHKG